MLPFALAAAILQTDAPKAALLIGITVQDQVPAQDCALIRQALVRRGWISREIQVTTGPLSADQLRYSLASFVERASRGSAIVFLSGPGSQQNLFPGVLVQGGTVPWAQVLGPLGQANGQRYQVLTDTGHTNLLYGRIPRNVSLLSVEGSWQAVNQPRRVGNMVHNGTDMNAGILSYIIARELPYSSTLSELAYRIGKYKDSGSMAAIWADLPRTQVFGNGSWPIPGITITN